MLLELAAPFFAVISSVMELLRNEAYPISGRYHSNFLSPPNQNYIWVCV